MSEVTLHFFDLYGFAEPIRMILTFFDISFNDHRLSLEEWHKLKAEGFVEFDLLPALDIDGMRLVESEAICNYIARKYEFAPENHVDTYLVDSVCEYRLFILSQFTDVVINNDEEGWQKLMHEKMPYFLRKFERRLEQNNGGFGFFVGITISMADFMMFDIVFNHCLRPGKIEKYGQLVDQNAPKCKALCERIINSSDRFRDYLEKRPYKNI